MLYESRRRKLQIPYALLKVVADLHEQNPEIDSGELLRRAILEVFPEHKGAVEECAVELARAMNQHAEEVEKEKGKRPPGEKRSLLGQSTRDWLFSMDADAVCTFLADWDYEKALYLYWQVDHRDVMRMFEIKAEYEETRIAIAYEGALYGFGGELKGQGSRPSEGTKVYDMTQGGEEAEKGWAALGMLSKRRN